MHLPNRKLTNSLTQSTQLTTPYQHCQYQIPHITHIMSAGYIAAEFAAAETKQQQDGMYLFYIIII